MKVYFENNGNEYFVKEYLVQIHDSYNNSVWSSMKTANEILNWLDMDDCYPELSIKVFDVETQFGTVEELEVYGTWHNFKEPLYMKVTHSDGTIAFDGYGTDH